MASATYILWLRSVKRYFRSRSRMFGSLAQPLFFFFALGFGLSNVVSTSNGSYTAFIAPGIIAMSVLFSSVFSGIQIIWDRQFGFLKETLVAPVSRISIMLGQTLGGATTSIIQGCLIFVLLLLIGSLKISFGILLAFLFMALIGLSFTAMGIAIASRIEDMEGFPLIMNFVIMPIFFLSGALFPLTNAPSALKVITYLNPLTYGVEGMRYALLGSSSINPLVCLSVLGGFGLLMVFLGAFLFNRIKA
ncbi:ABC-2 type transporter [uncultured archaeon]|nr:ABC-2 type transporter [uncultured archaeon]